MRRTPMTKEEVYEMLAFYHSPQGTIANTCEKFNTKRQTLTKYRKMYYDGTLEEFFSKPSKPKKLTKELAEKDVEDYPDDTYVERSKRLNLAPTYICTLFHEYNISYKKNSSS